MRSRERSTSLLYQIPGKRKPQFEAPARGEDEEKVDFYAWMGIALTVIGSGWVTRQLFRLIDWIERD